MSAITSATIDNFTAKRLQESASNGAGADEATKKKLPRVSPATVNKEIRYVRSIRNLAEEWKLIAKAPKVRFLKVAKKLPTYIPPEHSSAIYQACNVAKRPWDIPNITPEGWWQGLMITAYMTGWRISQLLDLKWSEVDLDAGHATTIAEATGNKGKRDDRVPLHPIVVSHLKKLVGTFDSHVFPWPQNKRDLWPEFQRIQEAAQLANRSPMPKAGKGGRWYGFNDLRRGFATMNAESMDLFQLQGLMQHKSLETTREYVNMAKRLKKPVENLFVPTIRLTGETG